MRQARPFHEVARKERLRRVQIRTGLVSLLAIFAVGWFAPDRVSYAAGVIAVVVVGLIASVLYDAAERGEE